MKINKLYVGNLSYQTEPGTLEQAFSEYGKVIEVTLIEGKGFAFVEMDSLESAQSAMEALNGIEIDGRSIRLDEARPQRQKDRGSYDKRTGRGENRGSTQRRKDRGNDDTRTSRGGNRGSGRSRKPRW